jgi:hypothetical protein
VSGKRLGGEGTAVRELIDAIRKAIATENWFGALFMSLALPDICSALEQPARKVGERYRDWFRRYLASKYDDPPTWAGIPVRFTADDSYLFRCSLLHQGMAEDDKQRTTFDRIHFVEPPGNFNVIHQNMMGDTLQLQVDIFCEDYCRAAERWLHDVETDAEIQQRMAKLITIHPVSSLPVKFRYPL